MSINRQSNHQRQDMESTLSTAFDHLSSSDPVRRRKGLRQCEVFFSKLTASQKQSPRSPSLPSSEFEGLSSLVESALYREFFKLQDNFEYNVTLRLLSTLESLLSAPLTPNPHQSSTTQLLTSALSLVQGSLLMHPPSRTLFAQERYMNILLDLFDDEAAPSVQSGALLVLVCAMLDHPRNIRTFERLDGVWQVTHLFKVRSTTREVKRAVIEFLYFYLMPEGLEDGKGWVRAAMATATGAVGAKGRGRGDTVRRSQKEKQELLRMHLTHVDDLVGDLQQGSGPFGEAR